MDVRTTRLGELETVRLPDGAALTFPDGLPGFEDHTAFVLIEDEVLAPFHWLQSLSDPHIGFLVIEPDFFLPDYSVDVSDADVDLLRLGAGAQPRILAILVVPEDPRAITANLQAPIVINSIRRIAKQVILTDDVYSLRHPIFGAPIGAAVAAGSPC